MQNEDCLRRACLRVGSAERGNRKACSEAHDDPDQRDSANTSFPSFLKGGSMTCVAKELSKQRQRRSRALVSYQKATMIICCKVYRFLTQCCHDLGMQNIVKA